MGIISTKPITERDPGPYEADRRCARCDAFLSRSNPGPNCAPCSGGDWIPLEPTEAELKKLRGARLEELMAA